MSNNIYEIVVPCLFGMEAIVKREITDLGYEISHVDDGRITFKGDAEAIVKANVWIRAGERVMVKVGQFKAVTFDQLFERIKEIPWENYIPKDGKFWVSKATSIKSELFSPSDIQSIAKKAMVERLKKAYKVPWFEEKGASYPVRIFIKKDIFEVTLDATGNGLHKRGYRAQASRAPIRESLAAGIVLLSVWNNKRILVDPFCGSGTILIEAAMIGANMAPGLNREFIAEGWTNFIDKKLWSKVADEAIAAERTPDMNIQGYDLDFRVLKIARENAELAGVADYIHFQDRPFEKFSSPKQYGVVITNPPYGERLDNKEVVEKLYASMGEILEPYDTWSKYMITSFEGFEQSYGKKATKKRKLYSGMLKTNLYQYLGKRPPKRAVD